MPPLDLDLVFGALSDPTRRAILARLLDGEATVNELVEPFDISQPAISKHLKVLERAGLISRTRDAQRRPCLLERDALARVAAWLQPFLAEDAERPEPEPPPRRPRADPTEVREAWNTFE